MRIARRVMWFVMIVFGFTVWSALDRYVSPGSSWYRPSEVLTWLVYMGAIIMFSAGDSRQRALEQYEVTGWKWLWLITTVLLGCIVWAVELSLNTRVAAWIVWMVYIIPLLVLTLIARVRERRAEGQA